MILTDRERTFLSECCASGATRKGRIWHAGNYSLTRFEIGRLIRSGLLIRYRDHCGVSAAARRLVAAGKSPPVGVEIQARGSRRTLRGRVLVSAPNEAILEPLDEHAPATVYVVHRPHAAAPWKGAWPAIRKIGQYLGRPEWAALAHLAPPIWTAPLTTEPHTLARLREVNAKLDSIGAHARTVEEAAARVTVPTFGNPLEGIRWRIGREDWQSSEVRDYFAEVIRRDPQPFDAADFAYARQRVWEYIFPEQLAMRSKGPRDPRTLAEVSARLKYYVRPEMVQRAYACLVPRARWLIDDADAKAEALRRKYGNKA